MIELLQGNLWACAMGSRNTCVLCVWAAVGASWACTIGSCMCPALANVPSLPDLFRQGLTGLSVAPLLKDDDTGRPYGALNYGTSFLYLRDSELRDGDAYGTSLLTGLFNYRTLHREGRQRELTGRRGEGARAPLYTGL